MSAAKCLHFKFHLQLGENVHGSQRTGIRLHVVPFFWVNLKPGGSERRVPTAPGPPVVSPNAWDVFLEWNHKHEPLLCQQTFIPSTPITGLSSSLRPIFSHKNVLTIQLSELKKIKDVFFFWRGRLANVFLTCLRENITHK